MIKEYLLRRATVLTERIRTNKEKFEHNQIAIVESNNQIKELNDTIDEATQIFSIKAREDNGFKRQEISDLEIRIATYVSENKDYKEVIDTTEKELNVVNQCLEEIENINVSRETLHETNSFATTSNAQLKIQSKESVEDFSDDKDMKIATSGLVTENITDDEGMKATTDRIATGNIPDDEDMKIVIDGSVTDKKTAEIINKLKLCKSIAEIDGKRVSVEIDNIISMLKK